MIMIIKLFLVQSLINRGTSDDSNRGLNAPDLFTNPTLESTAATPAKRKNLATSDGNSPGKPRGFTVSPRSKKLRSPGGRGQIVWVSPGSMGRMWRTYVPEEADDNERNGIYKKRRKADSAFASKQAKGLEMTPEEKAAENEKNAELKKARRKREKKTP